MQITPRIFFCAQRVRQHLGNIAFIIKARVETLREVGAALSPFNALQFINGLETLHLRVKRLQRDARVGWVRYPGLEGDSAYPLAKHYFQRRLRSVDGLRRKGRVRSGQEADQFGEALVAAREHW